MTKWTDKKGRDIDIEVSENNVYAYHQSKKIGEVTTTGPIEVECHVYDEPPKITGWEVDEAYRRAGICTKMVQLLVEEVGMLQPADRDMGIGGQNALTTDGEYINRHCQGLGLIYPFIEDRPPDDDFGYGGDDV